MRIDDFKAQLKGGGVRPNLFRVRGGFPSGASSAIGTIGGVVAGAAAGGVLGAASNLLGGNGASRQMEFLCKAASLPGSNIGMIEVPFRGRTLRVPGDRTFQDWQLTVIADTDFQIRNAFERWMNDINSHVGNVGPGGLLAVQQTWVVEQLDKFGPSIEPQPIKSYRFTGCFPTEISPIDLSYDSTDQIAEFTVTMAYTLWESDTTT